MAVVLLVWCIPVDGRPVGLSMVYWTAWDRMHASVYTCVCVQMLDVGYIYMVSDIYRLQTGHTGWSQGVTA